MPAGVSNGSIVQGDERLQVIDLLAQGFSVHHVAQRFNHDHGTIAAVRDAEFAEVQRRKPILAAQAERNALLAGEQIAQALAQGKFPVNSLPVVYGVSIDKVIALRDPLSGSQQHLHLHLQPNDVAGRFNALLASLTEKARLLPAHQTSPDVTADDTNTIDATTDPIAPTTKPVSSEECAHSHAPSKNTNALEVSQS